MGGGRGAGWYRGMFLTRMCNCFTFGWAMDRGRRSTDHWPGGGFWKAASLMTCSLHQPLHTTWNKDQILSFKKQALKPFGPGSKWLSGSTSEHAR